jgi:hypothetical protein
MAILVIDLIDHVKDVKELERIISRWVFDPDAPSDEVPVEVETAWRLLIYLKGGNSYPSTRSRNHS